jgi:sugar O-acyltransferase (sialic acid O-acetyltransferase NeuD family)
MKEKLVLVGGGGHCISCIDVIEAENKYEIVGIVDLKENLGKNILGYEVFGTDDDLPELSKKYDYFLITLGQIKSANRRKKLFSLLREQNVKFPTIISPNSYVSKHSRVEEGTIIMHGAIINAKASIGKNCIVNSNALIEHGVQIDDHCHISTASVVNGDVKIENESFIGSGATIVQGKTVRKNSFIKAHSLFKGE